MRRRGLNLWCGLGAEDLLDRLYQAVDMNVEVAARLDLGRIAISELADAFGKFRRLGHPRRVEQHGKDP